MSRRPRRRPASGGSRTLHPNCTLQPPPRRVALVVGTMSRLILQACPQPRSSGARSSLVFSIVLATMWAATQWTAWRLGYQPQLGQPWFELRRHADLSARRPSSGGGSPMTPMRRRSSSRAPASRRPAASSRSPLPSACRSGGRARRRTSRPMARRAGRRSARSRAPGLLGPDGVVLGSSIATIFAMTARSMCCVLRRHAVRQGRRPRRSDAADLAGLAIVHDIKGENWQLTAGFRARLGRVLLFDPTNPTVRRLQSAARGPPRRVGGPRRPECRRRPGRSRRRARAPQPLGEDQPFAAGRRHPACPLRRGGQDAGRRRRLPVRSEAADRGDASAR